MPNGKRGGRRTKEPPGPFADESVGTGSYGNRTKSVQTVEDDREHQLALSAGAGADWRMVASLGGEEDYAACCVRNPEPGDACEGGRSTLKVC